jgi:hypothetical protein
VKCLIRISAGTPSILTFFCDFPVFLQANTGIVPLLAPTTSFQILSCSLDNVGSSTSHNRPVTGIALLFVVVVVCVVFFVCIVPFIVCVALCAVFYLSVVCYFV